MDIQLLYIDTMYMINVGRLRKPKQCKSVTGDINNISIDVTTPTITELLSLAAIREISVNL